VTLRGFARAPGSASYTTAKQPLTGKRVILRINGTADDEGASMKEFALESKMVTMGGVFYPTGYMVLMFPTEQDARNAERKLEEDGYNGESICLMTPEDIQGKVARTVGNADMPLPSAGTEADTVRRYAELASQGHHALMIHSPNAADTEHIMRVLKDAPISYGQKYRQLVIEDLVE
jgi:hypothetical protein